MHVVVGPPTRLDRCRLAAAANTLVMIIIDRVVVVMIVVGSVGQFIVVVFVGWCFIVVDGRGSGRSGRGRGASAAHVELLELLPQLGRIVELVLVVELELTLEFGSFQIGHELVDNRLECAVVRHKEQRVTLMQEYVAFRTVRVLFQVLYDAFFADLTKRNMMDSNH